MFSSLMLGCDESDTKKASPARAGETVGNASAAGLPHDVGETLADDYQATVLLTDAYSALDRKEYPLVETKLAEVEKLSRVSPGIGQQVAEIKAKMQSGRATSTTAPADK